MFTLPTEVRGVVIDELLRDVLKELFTTLGLSNCELDPIRKREVGHGPSRIDEPPQQTT